MFQWECCPRFGTKRKIKIFWSFICFVTVFIVIPILLYQFFQKKTQKHVIAWEVAGIFVILSVPISLFGIFLHVNNWTNPDEQRYIIRILFMSPIYAIDSWLALTFIETAIYFDTMREMYEAFAIYSFAMYLQYSVQRLEQCPTLEKLESGMDSMMQEKPMHHMIPFCWLPTWDTGATFLRKFKSGVVSYSIIRVLLGIIAFIAQFAGVYHDGDLEPNTLYFWVSIINNFSQLWAMYCLVQFYHFFANELKPINPFPKFLCIKLVVFFSFWQGMFIAFLVKVNVIKENDDWTKYDIDDVSTGLQNFIIGIEMFIAAIGHVYAFPHDSYRKDQKVKISWCQKLRIMLDVRDIQDDVYGHVQILGQDIAETANRTKELLSNEFKGAANSIENHNSEKLVDNEFRSSQDTCEKSNFNNQDSLESR